MILQEAGPHGVGAGADDARGLAAGLWIHLRWSRGQFVQDLRRNLLASGAKVMQCYISYVLYQYGSMPME